jgi:hypothetical protein
MSAPLDAHGERAPIDMFSAPPVNPLNPRERSASTTHPMRTGFTAWIICDGKSDPVETAGDCLASCADEVAQRCAHKDSFVILETAPVTGKATAHFFTVKKKSTPRWVTVEHVTRRVHDLYAETLFSCAVEAFQPLERWNWSPGADVVGIDRNTIDAPANVEDNNREG